MSSHLLSIALALAWTGSAVSQTTLTVNGVPPLADNGDVITVELGTVMTLLIENADHAGGAYGLFASDGDNGNLSGWWLDVGQNAPFPVVTGIGTVTLEGFLASQGLTVDFVPDRVGNPNVDLDDSGLKFLRFRIPETLSIPSIKLQAATQAPGTLMFEFSAGVELNFVSPSKGARLLISRDSTAGDPDAVEFGVLEFKGNEASGLYTPSALGDVDVQEVLLSDLAEWQSHVSGGVDHADDVGIGLGDAPGLRADNDVFPRVRLPESGSVPARDLLRCYDNSTGEGMFLIVNHGANPNTPGVDFQVLDGSRMSGGANPWQENVAVNADGTRMLAVVEGGASDKVYLVATDGTTPYGGAGAVDITPGNLSSEDFDGQRANFTEEHVFFVLNDPANDASAGDLDGFEHHLYTATLGSSSPVVNEISIPVTGNSTVVDYVAERSLIVSADGGTLVFLGGDTFGAAPVDHVADSDWYRVLNSSPTSATNFTQIGTVNEDSSFPLLFAPGAAYDGQSGFASLSPLGRSLAFVARHHDENGSGAGDEDEVYFVATNGTGTSGLLSNQVTTNARVDTANTVELAFAQDLFAVNDTELLFFYGANDSGHTGNRSMDLMFWDGALGDFQNLTATGGAQIPVDTVGAIYPEGYFTSPSGNYLYFARGDSADALLVNLVGIDLRDGSVFNVTGGEFSGSSVEESENPGSFGDNYALQLRYAGGAAGSLVYFASTTRGAGAPTGQQVWAFDADFPFGAFRVTDQNLAAGTEIQSLTPDSDTLGAAWAWISGGAGSGPAADLYYLDLARGLLDDLTESGFVAAFSRTSIAFVPAEDPGGDGSGGATQPGLVYAAGNMVEDNPTNAVFFYVALDDSTDKTGTWIKDTDGTLLGNILQVYHASFD